MPQNTPAAQTPGISPIPEVLPSPQGLAAGVPTLQGITKDVEKGKNPEVTQDTQTGGSGDAQSITGMAGVAPGISPAVESPSNQPAVVVPPGISGVATAAPIPDVARSQESQNVVETQVAQPAAPGRSEEPAEVSRPGVAAPLYSGMTAKEAATLAARHGHTYEDALRNIQAKPSAWIPVLLQWKEAEDTDRKAAAKAKRVSAWRPNDRQNYVLDLATRGSIGQGLFSKDNDLPMAPHHRASTWTLIAHRAMRRVDHGDTVEYPAVSQPTGVAVPPDQLPVGESGETPVIQASSSLVAASRNASPTTTKPD